MKIYHLDDYVSGDFDFHITDETGCRSEAIHRHDCFELMLIAHGSGICDVSGHHYPMLRGDLYLIGPGDTHAFTIDRNFSYFNIMFQSRLFTAAELAVLNRFPPFSAWLNSSAGPGKFNVPPPHCDRLEAQARAIETEYHHRAPAFELSTKAMFIRFLIEVFRHLGPVHDDEESSGSGLAISRLINYIDRHYAEKLTTAGLARIVRFSPGYLRERFTRTVGISLFEYIGRLRIEKSRAMLEESGENIGMIAQNTGFYDSSYYTRSFRRYTGMSPSQYRRLSHTGKL